ncbi:NAD(P)H-binding protein [Marichromatium sp. AB31]|uniref:NAD(P)H-binding protein n=1 Tax=Marichromatium sp. AB31 TaxID=2483362 RepID=UPI000F3F2EFC|nr:NAD(P)H-binding protein [Marichromatium sp. AB31]RNE91922.1 NAD-dependent epimerase/dehydratase family protein [Marichromatium sp. AB31]
MSEQGRPQVAVAGASGFIGTALCRALAEHHEVVALTRSPARARIPDPERRIGWRRCDLFDVEAVRAGLQGCDLAVYLVHSNAPSSRLTQAAARDMDLILADNFARAAAACGVRQIVFVSALIPEGFEIAPLLWSRREVELTLAAHGTPVSVLRAGLVVGPGGSGLGLLVDLVRRLPLLALPPEARSPTRPIALDDLVRAILLCLERPEDYRGVFDLGGPEWLSHAEMVRQCAEVMGVRRWVFTLPWLPLGVVAWVARRVSGASPALVGPVVESLPQRLRIRDNALQRAIAPSALAFRRALAQSLAADGRHLQPNPRRPIQLEDRAQLREASRVRSIQRIILPPGQDAAWVAGNYFRWLGRCCWPLVASRECADGGWEVGLRLPRVVLLRLRPAAAMSTAQRRVYHIDGGLLARAETGGRFEFHTLLDGRYTMAAIHDYAPALPWYLYLWTQAAIHLRVMRRYQRRLARLAR